MIAKICARCGKRLPANGLRVYSSFSRNYYCANVSDRRVRKAVVA